MCVGGALLCVGGSLVDGHSADINTVETGC